MNTLILRGQFIIAAMALFAAGCATRPDVQASAPQHAVQSSTGPVMSGYIDVGAAKSFAK
jgi:uncharacterized lipoprotein YajG